MAAHSVGDLKTLQTVTALSLAANNFKHPINQVSRYFIMPRAPEIGPKANVGPLKESTTGSSKDGVYRARFCVNKHRARYVLLRGQLGMEVRNLETDVIGRMRGVYFFEIDIHALQLQVGGTRVSA